MPVEDRPMKHIFIFLISFILLSSFTLMLIPNNVRAVETEYLNVDFQDGSTAPFIFNSGNWFQVQTDGTGNYYLADTRTTKGLNSMYCDLISWTPHSFEISFDFKITNIVDSYSLFALCNSTATPKNPTGDANFYVNILSNGSMYIDGTYTSFIVNDGNWHNLFVNITYGDKALISLDGSTPLKGYYSYAGGFSHVYYCMFGSTSATTNAVCFWDNITIVSRLGSSPIASFDYNPLEGDGLTNFVFTDTSIIDNILFPVTYNWTFGDGNYTLTKNSNHTYIFEGTYQVILNVSNRFGYDLAYTNITVTGISIGGGEEVSDDMFGFIALLVLITALNLYAMKSDTALLSIFALMGLIVSASLLWPDSPITTALLMVSVLGNIAITIKTVT